MPIIVGSPRSGTTLLRLMLDAHPQLAIPPETGFIAALARLRGNEDQVRAAFIAAVVREHGFGGNWPDFHLDAGHFVDQLAAIRPFDVGLGLRLFYRLYAERFGKPRWGDKTPLYCRQLDVVHRLLPEAHFIHLIRDGRDAALSLRRQWFSPGPLIEHQAWHWRRNIEAARRLSTRVPHYLELRYEALLTEPEASLRRLCAYLALDFDAAMLRHWERAPARIAEHAPRRAADGRVLLDTGQRHAQQWQSTQAPDPSRIGAWRQALRRDEQLRFRLVARSLLDELGYPRR